MLPQIPRHIVCAPYQANATASENVAQVRAKVLTAADMLCEEAMCQLVTEAWPRRVDACFEAGGGHFEYTLGRAHAGDAEAEGDPEAEDSDAEGDAEAEEDAEAADFD